MKSTFRIIVMVLVAAFYGCQKSDVSVGLNSSVSSDGVFSGTIVNDSNRIDSIKVYDNIVDSYNVVVGDNILGKSAVLSSGKFLVVLTNPVLRKIGTGPSGVVVSDTTAMVGSMSELEANKGGIYNGNINKSNFNISDSTKAGVSTSQFMYSDRTFTIKGIEIDADNTTSTFKSNLKINYTLTFKKGWNEIVMKVDSYSATSTTETTVETYSNTVSSDLQWRYYPNNNASSVRTKTQGVHSIARPTFLFK